MIKRFLKTVVVFSASGIIVFIALLSSYIYYDPFKVIRKYHDYSYPHVITDRDYVSTEMFTKNYKKYHYDSFIFGSSRTTAFDPNTWRRYLAPNASPYMFDASSESLYGIDLKLKILSSMHIPLKNIILVLCRDQTFNKSDNSSEHLYIKHPLLTGQSWFAFELTFFKAYSNPKFLWHFYEYTLTGTYKASMKGYIENRRMRYDSITNQQRIMDQEEEISKNPDGYYEKRKNLFYTRIGERTDSIQRIQKEHIVLLTEIKNILEKNKANYKIVLSPLYEQVKFNKKDRDILEELFPGHVYDFSGKNEFTDNVRNYYETSHYRLQIGDSILKTIYKGEPPKHNWRNRL